MTSYGSTTVSNNGLIKFNRFVSRFIVHMCNCFLKSMFTAPTSCLNIRCNKFTNLIHKLNKAFVNLGSNVVCFSS